MVLDDMTSLQIHAEWGSLRQLAEAYVPAHRIFAVLRGGQKGIVCVAGPWPKFASGEGRAIRHGRRCEPAPGGARRFKWLCDAAPQMTLPFTTQAVAA